MRLRNVPAMIVCYESTMPVRTGDLGLVYRW